MMNERAMAAASALLLAAAGCLGTVTGRAGGKYRIPGAGEERSVGSLVAEGFSVRKIMADRRWFDVLQYCGAVEFVLDRGEKLFRKADLATDMDPTFVHVYEFASTSLMWEVERPQEALALLDKGIHHNPKADRLKLYRAAIVYRRLEDLASELKVIEKLALAPGAPFSLLRILANAYDRTGRYGKAAVVVRHVLQTSSNPDHRRWAAAKQKSLSRKTGRGGGRR